MLRRTTINELTRRTVHRDTVVEQLPYWPEMKGILDSGLAPQEAVELVLTKDMQTKYGAEYPRTIVRFLKKYVQSKGKRYTVKHIKRDTTMYYQISNPVPIVKRKKATA